MRQDKYFSIFSIATKELFVYPQQLIATGIIVATRMLVLLVIYHYAFAYRGGSINGITQEVAIWSLAVHQMLLFVQFRGIFRTISAEIRQGTLETQLTKPYHYLFYKFWEQLGKGVPTLCISVLAVLPIVLVLTGLPDSAWNFTMVIGAIFLMFGGTLVSACLYILIALPALWIDDATPFYWIVDKSIMIFGGAYIPIALLPAGIQSFVSFTPFGAPMFATQMFNPNFTNLWPALLSVQAFWISFLLLLIVVVFYKAQQALAVNGG